ncbi:MAG: methionyl-tRNA formyltransferase [Trueperaceae bacterium]|nr:methionyl-tRNA formyltransferase [Trueperaceae bacterium]
MSQPLRVAFFGSPAFAVPVLQRLQAEHEVVLVVTQPDAPAGRGMRVRVPPVASEARLAGLPLDQPARVRRDGEFADRLRAARPDVAVTAAYGQILPASLLSIPGHGFLNAHASLLPQLRGAAPIQWALILGHHETGITVMETEAGMDTGPVRHVLRTAIEPSETAPELSERLSRLAARAISEALSMLAEGRLPRTPQDDANATYAPLLTKDDGDVRWQDDAADVVNRWRGVRAWPGTRFRHHDRQVRVDLMELAASEGRQASAGDVLSVDADGVAVACGAGAVRLRTVTPAGRASMPAADWARGAHLEEGERLA